MSNKSSSVFGGKTSRWELGGNPRETLFSKPTVAAQEPVTNLGTITHTVEAVPSAAELEEEDTRNSDFIPLTDICNKLMDTRKYYIFPINQIDTMIPNVWDTDTDTYHITLIDNRSFDVSAKFVEEVIVPASNGNYYIV